MPSVKKSVELSGTQREAFGLATDTSRYEEWLTIHDRWPDGPPADVAEGSTFQQGIKIMGMPANVQWTVEAFEPDTRMVLKGAGPMGAQLATTITADGTTVSYEAEFSGGGIQGPMGDMVTQKAGEEIEVSLGRLKELS